MEDRLKTLLSFARADKLRQRAAPCVVAAGEWCRVSCLDPVFRSVGI